MNQLLISAPAYSGKSNLHFTGRSNSENIFLSLFDAKQISINGVIQDFNHDFDKLHFNLSNGNDLLQINDLNYINGLNATIDLGNGSDMFVMSNGHLNIGTDITVFGGSGYDYISFIGLGAESHNSKTTANGGSGNDTMFASEFGSELAGGSGADKLIGGISNDVLIGNVGNDTIHGGFGNDLIFGSDYINLNSLSSDFFTYKNDNNILFGEEGDDTIIGGSHSDTIDGGAGHDYLEGLAGDDVMNGGAGHDFINGGAGNDVIRGGAGNDTIVGGAGYNEIFGGAGNDHVYSGNGDDLIYAGAGDDTIWLSAGYDRIEGGKGKDTFIIGKTSNVLVTINDFVYGEDILKFNFTSSYEKFHIYPVHNGIEVTIDVDDSSPYPVDIVINLIGVTNQELSSITTDLINSLI